MIDGVIVTPLRQIFDERGKVMHMMREDSSVFSQFGEIYFSCVYSGAIKAWKRHTKMTLNCAVIHGEIKFVLFDDRIDSPTMGMTQEFLLSPENYCLVTVPPLIWTGSRGMDDAVSILANCANIPHDPAESEHKTVFDSSIGYDWGVDHEVKRIPSLSL